MYPRLKPVLLAVVLPVSFLEAAVSWNDSSADFNNPASWTGGLPDASSVGYFPLDGSIANQPNLTGSISVGGIEFAGAGYTISGGANVLTIGVSGVTSTGAGTNAITSAIATAASTAATWNIDAGNTLNLSGALTAGTGSTVTKTGAGTLTLSQTSGQLASTLKIQGGKVVTYTNNMASALELSNGGHLDLAFSGNTPGLNVPLILGIGGGIISATSSAATTRIDSYFSGSGNLELQGKTSGTTSYFQVNTSVSKVSTNTGKTTISLGVVRVSGGYSIGDTSTVTVNTGAELQIRASEKIGGLEGAGTVSSASSANILTTGGGNTNTAFAGVLRDDPAIPAGTLALVKEGTGVQTLSGNSNNYSGGTTVNAGTLLVTNTSGSGTGTGSVTIKNGANLTGTGQIAGAVSIQSGGTLGAGDGSSASGILTLAGNVTLEDNSTIQLALGSSLTSHSSLAGTGGEWSFDNDQKFSFLTFGAVTGRYEGIITGLTASVNTSAWTISSATNPGLVGTFSYNAGTSSIDLTLTTVPEPTTLGLLVLGAAGVCFISRRKGSR